ncbi:hypothetical protein H5410_060732 [Solanum commersonii]|uniref:FBD domain-containing protein n=1 Tax=Solanum commersonii TaxID=4109 RepID=A0A9J5W7G5_SOLCO|nr:hypothetical protein H5410_060732 [Solanum commersonii]
MGGFDILRPFLESTRHNFDVGRGSHLLIVGKMQMVDNKFLYFKTFLPLDNLLRSTSDFQFDFGRGRHFLTVGGMKMVDNTFLYFKNFLPLDNLLRSTHNLENLMIFYDMPCEDIDLIDDKYLSFEQNIFKVSLQNLKNVKVMPFCSRTRSFDAIKLHQFLKFLLDHAINPEKLDIVPDHKDCNSFSTSTSM